MAACTRGVPGSRLLLFRFAGVALACAVLLALGTAAAQACVGARSLAMGGAFIALADDSSAAYWNPAGLVALGRQELSLTHTLNNRDRYNYDEFLTYAWSCPDGSAAGVSFVAEHTGTERGQGPYDSSDWLWCSVARTLSSGFSVGANVRYETYAHRAAGTAMLAGSRWGLDVGLLYRASPALSLGLLVQDAGFAPIVWQGGGEEAVSANVRPGLAYRPDARTVIALDAYDLGAFLDPLPGGGSGSFAVRAGVERQVADSLIVRLGYYGISRNVGAITCGVGWRAPAWHVDYAYLGGATTPGHPGLGGTHQIGVTFKF